MRGAVENGDEDRIENRLEGVDDGGCDRIGVLCAGCEEYVGEAYLDSSEQDHGEENLGREDSFLQYKWRKVKPWLVKRKLWCYYTFFLMGIAALMCFGIYHNRVMQMDKTNRIFYQTVIQTRRDAEIWQDIDSIVKGIKLHLELQADPPKKNN